MTTVARVNDIAEITGLDGNTIRRWCDEGVLDCNRDFRNYRVFPEPLMTIKTVQKLIRGEISMDTVKAKQSSAMQL